MNNSFNNNFLSFKFKHSQKLYEEELRIREQTGNKFTPTITILIAIITAWITLFSKKVTQIDINAISLADIIIFALLIATLVFIVISCLYFVKCFLFFEEEITDPIKVKEKINDSEKCLIDHELDEVLDNLYKLLANSYIEAAIVNYKHTSTQMAFLRLSYHFIIASVVSLGVSFLFISCI